jgi:hypothetical protein
MTVPNQYITVIRKRRVDRGGLIPSFLTGLIAAARIEPSRVSGVANEYWEGEGFPGYVAVAIGNFSDPNFPAPTREGSGAP